MLTTHPSIMLGSYIWDENRLPRDEFDIRCAHLQSAMSHNGWAATLIYGDAREHAALAFFTNFIPRMRWALALIPATGEPRLLASMSSRDMPAMRSMTWISDVRSAWEWEHFNEFCARLPVGGKIATIATHSMTPMLLRQVEESVRIKLDLVSADSVSDEARSAQRPREIALIRSAAKIARSAGSVMLASWREGSDMESAALESERAARELAVQDVRTLLSRDGGRTLEPFSARFDNRPSQRTAYVAIKSMGYWAEIFCSCGHSSSSRSRAVGGLDVLLAGFVPGESVRGLVEKVTAITGPQQPFLSRNLGSRIGLSLCDGDPLSHSSDARVSTNTVYALRVGAVDQQGGAIASAMVHIRNNGQLEVMLRSNPEER